MATNNPYESPGNPTKALDARPQVAPLDLMKRGAIRGAAAGFVAGCLAAVSIALLGEYGFLYPLPASAAGADADRFIVLAIIALAMVALIGGLLGGTGGMIAGFVLGWIASRKRSDFRGKLIVVATCSFGIVGAIGGAAMGFTLSGAGHDGEPILWSCVTISCLLSLFFGMIAGYIHGRDIANTAWGREIG